MTIVWLNGGFVAPEDACLSYDDPGVRFGEGLFESIRSENGVAPLLDRHMARLERSIAALRLPNMPAIATVAEAVRQVAAAIPTGVGKVRATLTPFPTLLVEGSPAHRPKLPVLSAISLPDAWLPTRGLSEHKTLSFLGWRDAQRRAEAAGADTALLLDAEGRLGEAATANVFCAVAGELVTAPVRGLLPGTTRALVLERMPVREAILDDATWRAADELILTSAITLVAAIGRVDDALVGDGAAGPMARAVLSALSARR